MKNNKNILIEMFASIVILIVLETSFVSAFSVSSPYMGNKTLNLFPDSKITDLEFILQNGGGATENVSVRVSILEGSEIVSLLGESNIYTVSPGAKVPVNLRITLPEGVAAGDSYNIRLEFSTVSSGQSGQFGFGTGQEQNFKVAIVEKVVSKNNNLNSIYLFLIIGILLVVAIIAILVAKRKNKTSTRKK